MAASLTAPGRTPHSMHVYYVRAGDAREPVDFLVDVARDGGSLSTRQITARQNGQILLEVLASFSAPIESLDYYQPMPDVPDPEALPPVQEQLADYADELGGHWVRPQAFDLRYVDAPPRLALELSEPPAANANVVAAQRFRTGRRGVAQLPTDVPVGHDDGRGGTRTAATDTHRHLQRAHRPRPVVSPARRLVGLGTVRPGFAQWCRWQRTDDIDDVQPGGPTGLHRDPGALLRPKMNRRQDV